MHPDPDHLNIGCSANNLGGDFRLKLIYRRPSPVNFTVIIEPKRFGSISEAANYALHNLRHSNFSIDEVCESEWNEIFSFV